MHDKLIFIGFNLQKKTTEKCLCVCVCVYGGGDVAGQEMSSMDTSCLTT